jgi:hypothetical protein
MLSFQYKNLANEGVVCALCEYVSYRIIKQEIEIWGIGKRDKLEIYKIIRQRISNRK